MVDRLHPLAAALLEFAARIGATAPISPSTVEIVVDGSPVLLSEPVAGALVEALRAYHDPRDRGGCDHCGGRRISDDFLCADCGQPNGVFGQLIRERAARWPGPPTELD